MSREKLVADSACLINLVDLRVTVLTNPELGACPKPAVNSPAGSIPRASAFHSFGDIPNVP